MFKPMKKLQISTLVLVAFLALIVVDKGMTTVKAYNTDYDFTFDFVNDYALSDERTKDGDGTQAYVNCTFSEWNGDECQVWLWTLDSDLNCNREASTVVYLKSGEERYINNDAQIMETTWLKARLYYSVYADDNGGTIMSGRWRPDADVISR
ncbi:MAG: hypothetical protein ACI4E1_04760 [Lachnospira sp.]